MKDQRIRTGKDLLVPLVKGRRIPDKLAARWKVLPGYPEEKECIYVRVYRRLKHYGEEKTLEKIQVPPVDYDLRHTSSWLNFYMGRDHTAKQLGIVPPKKRGDK